MIVYYTDNSLPAWLEKLCQKQLRIAAGDREIITVSQRPIDFGDQRVVLGNIGRSYESYYKQILAGIELCEPGAVFTVEHDCLYTPAYFEFVLPSDQTFYYNKNVWFADLTGACRYAPRKAMSQGCADRDLFHAAIEEKLAMCLSDYPASGRGKYQCEPGVCDGRPEFIEAKHRWCDKHNRPYRQYSAEGWKAPLPNIDIRHGGNLSTPMSYERAEKFATDLPYWGNMRQYLNG